MNAIIDFLNTIFWGYVLIYGLLAVGIYFTIRLRLPADPAFRRDVPGRHCSAPRDRQGRHLAVPGALHQPRQPGRHRQHRRRRGGADPRRAGGDLLDVDGGAGRHGDGLFGIDAGAALQGPRGGRRRDGIYRGGPAFYIARGLGMPWLGAIFSVCLILSFGLVFNAVQANSIADAMDGAFGMPKLVTGLVVAGGHRGRDLRRHPQDRPGRRIRRAVHGRRLSPGGALRARHQPDADAGRARRRSSARPSASRRRRAASPAGSPRRC